MLVWRPCTYNVYFRLGSSASILRGCRDQLNGCEISSSAGAAVPTSVSAAPNPKRRRAVPAKSTMKILDCHRHFFFVFLLLPLLRLVSRSSILRSRSRFCLRSAMQVDRLIFLLFLFFSLLPFYSALIPLLIPLLIP